jgi:quinol monooxygenase YgiN
VTRGAAVAQGAADHVDPSAASGSPTASASWAEGRHASAMAVVITARYRAKPGAEELIREVLGVMRPASLQEPGCEAYETHVSEEEPGTFLLYERYVDDEAFQLHRDSEHFQRHVVARAIPNLDERTIERWELLG